MTHTLETLLPLLDKDGNPINQEASDKLRVWAAELDGWGWHYHNGRMILFSPEFFLKNPSYQKLPIIEWPDVDQIAVTPHYPTSLDAIYAAEKRAGLHERNDNKLRYQWWLLTRSVLDHLYGVNNYVTDFAFLTPAQRTVILILTLQQKQTL